MPSHVRRRRPRRHLTAILAIGIALAPIVPPVGAADDLDDRRQAAQERADAAQQRTEALQTSVEGLSAELAQSVSDLAALEARLPAAEQALRTAQDELTGAQRRAERIQAQLLEAADQRVSVSAELQDAEARDEAARASIAQLARQAYRSGGAASTLAVVLDAQDLADFARRTQATQTAQRIQAATVQNLADQVSASRNAELRLTAVTDRVGELEAQAAAEVVRADQARATAAAREQEIQQLIADQQATQQRLSGLKSQAEAEQTQVEAERSAIANELAAIIAEQKRAAAESSSPSSPAAPAPSNPGAGAIFSNPTSINPMYVTSSYGMRLHPILGYTRLHAGIDLRTYCNTPLFAPRDATVQWAKPKGTFGNQVMLDYGTVNGQPTMSSSNHMTSMVVRAGQQVREGDLIGYSGNTGLSGACHLHFEVYVNGSTVDPAPLLGR